VVRKVGGHVGKFRVQKYRVLAGVKTTVTDHRESGVRLKLDIAKVYFSPRLGHDRLRVAGLVKTGERVLVIGSGVGPYPLVIARHSRAKEVIGVEANPAAHKFALENARLNKLESRVTLVRGDAKRVVPELGRFDRVLITAPHQSAALAKVAVSALKDGGVLQYYTFAKEGQCGRMDGVHHRYPLSVAVSSRLVCGGCVWSAEWERVKRKMTMQRFFRWTIVVSSPTS
jgi:tRNA (guanine37-N1)-methyltransferase